MINRNHVSILFVLWGIGIFKYICFVSRLFRANICLLAPQPPKIKIPNHESHNTHTHTYTHTHTHTHTCIYILKCVYSISYLLLIQVLLKTMEHGLLSFLQFFKSSCNFSCVRIQFVKKLTYIFCLTRVLPYCC